MDIPELQIRRMTENDLQAVAALASAEDDSVWTAQDYLANDTVVATTGAGLLAGFASARTLISEAEHEVLNLLVSPQHRGQGIGSKLMKTLMASKRGIWFLEVREGNVAARKLYNSIDFNEFGRRKGYYQNPYEDAIVMRFCS